MSKRKSFIIHKDSLSVLDDLSIEQIGELFLAIKCFQLEEDYTPSPLVKIAFSPFKNQFIRDDEKYQEVCKARAEAGSKGGKQKVANASKSKQKVANLADSDSKSKNKSDSKNEYIIPNGINLNAWSEWESYRKEKKKKISKAAADKQFNLLLQYSEDIQQEIINNSISNDYQGLFAPKGSKTKDNAPSMSQSDIRQLEQAKKRMEANQ